MFTKDWTILDLLEYLDGAGLILTDGSILEDELEGIGLTLQSKFIFEKEEEE
jgi:hypothetical protein